MKRIFIAILCLLCLLGCSMKNNHKQDSVKEEQKVNEEREDENIRLVKKILSNMTLEEKVGQMIFARLPQSNVKSVIDNYHVGGFILFGVDFKNKSKEQVIKEIKSYQESSTLPLLLGVDEEGGTVVRISSNPNLYSHRFLSPQDIYNQEGIDGIINDTNEKVKLLKELGLNVNLAPVADISSNPNDFIYNRTLGKDAQETSEYIRQVVRIYNENNIGCTLKHFPGYGNNVDTHTGIAIYKREYNTFLENDFLPFQAGIEENVPSILVSHNIINSMDNEKTASLSKKVHEILRNDLNYNGVIMTDDLAMDAITLYSDNPYVEAVLAGNDLLITTDYKKTYEEIIKGVNNGTIDEELIDEAVLRILLWKYQLGLIEEG